MTGRPWRYRLLVAGWLVSAVLPAAPAAPQPAAVEIHHVHGLAFDQRAPDVLYAATHTGLVRLAPGAPPRFIGEHRFDLMGLTADPGNPDVVYASGHPDVATYERERVGNLGLLVSRDGGRTWQSVALRGQADFHALTLSPRGGGLLYGWSVAGPPGLYQIARATWRAERVAARGLDEVLALAASPAADGPLLAGTATGLRASRDGGINWSPVRGLPAAPVSAVAFHPSDPRRVYAYVHQAGAGLRRSADGGATWEPTQFGARAEAAVVALGVGPHNQVALATSQGDIARSADGGRTWELLVRHGRPAGAR